MSLKFGKLNFSTSFNPTAAFPLDARSYFESYSDAVKAAASATEAGKADSIYYYGQTLVVVENEKASFYIIQPNKTLTPILGEDNKTPFEIDSNLFEYNENNTLSLVGFKDAEAGSFFTKNNDGTLSWIKPIDSYTKDETDEKIAEAVSSATHLKRKIVSNLEEIEKYMASNIDADQYIFMVPTGLQEDDDKYDEYIVLFIADVPTIEKVGSWEVDLSDYAKIENVLNALNNKVDKKEGYDLIANTDLEKLLALKPTPIETVDENIFLIEDKMLQLKDIPITKVTGLEEILNKKIDAKPGYGLISATDQKKLDALLIGDSGNLEISGSVNAENVVNLAEWINEHASNTVGLSENNLTNDLYSKLVGALYISSVDTEELNVTDDGKLNIIKVDSSKITGLQEALNNKVNVDDFEDACDTIENLSQIMSNHAIAIENHDKDIQDLQESVTWQEII